MPPKGHTISREQRLIISEANRRDYAAGSRVLPGGFTFSGHQHSQESKDRIAQTLRGRGKSDETRRRMSQAQKGRIVSETTKVKQRLVMKGKPISAEHRAKISRGLKGKRHSQETIQKMREQSAIRKREWMDRLGRLWRFDSLAEITVAEVLDRHMLSWRFEPDTLLLSDGRTYIPDFWIDEWDAYLEVKFGSPKAIDKVTQANEDGHAVILLIGQDTTHLEEKMENLICVRRN